jgi:hypothetical protein
MKKSATNSKNTTSKTEKGLKHLRLVGVGRKYVEERFAEMQEREQQKTPQSKISYQTNGEKINK